MRFVFRAALLGASMLSPVVAFAQAAPAAPQAAASGDAVSDEDIVITARKFDEKLQNAPTTVAVATSATIDKLGLTSVADISKITPGLVLDNSFGRSGGDRPVIRGQANIGGFSGVAYFIDGIYYSGSLGDFDPYNIARMEVIKGPQSALYGRNTYSGAINIITKSPGDAFSGRVRADVSEHDRYDFSAGVSGPIGKGLGFILNGRYLDDKGEFRNAYDGGRLGAQRTASVSGMLKFDDDGPLRVSLRANYSDSKDGQPAIFSTTTYENNCFRDNGSAYKGAGRYFCGVLQPHPAYSDWTRRFTSPDVVGTRTKTLNSALRIDYDLSNAFTLTSLTGYNHRLYDVKLDGDYNGLGFQQGIFGSYAASFPNACGAGVPFGAGIYCIINAGAATDFTNSTHEKLRDFSQEVRLQYRSDRLKLLLGGYYFRQKVDNFDDRVLPADALAQAQAASLIQYAQFCAFIPGCTRAYGTTAVSVAPPDRNTTYLTTRNLAIFGS
ncbi:MAG: TonB-dependent receptor plug domain-containing protein, partial [Proteobacteria bacterium]|nr:TonB-dependent receptor plug domain-containing protein [Pseudomonadota bacterium]